MTLKRGPLPLLLIISILAAAGCVERTLVIRSDPIGAPVYVNGEPAGNTPLRHEFITYGVYSIEVGPLRDEKGMLLHESAEREVPVRAPWYQIIPLDFFAEVLWPGTLEDVHHVPLFKLKKASDAEAGRDAALKALDRAKTFRGQ
jgi:PEGA domain-containing protein